ncbi:MAG: ankyrin repeat domain-containing protein [Bacteroidetes bacterium]|nr:ankyrin repeat domain-containing protein [Bacteroidota bacterium]
MTKRHENMTNMYVKDPLFRQAVEAIDAGDNSLLKELTDKNPALVRDRLDHPTGDYFDRPYLLWFVADNPIRKGKLPGNIVTITAMLAEAVKRQAPQTAQQQLNYALGLVTTGRTPRESGHQIKMMDVLIDAGAKPGDGVAALANGNPDAAVYLAKRNKKLPLATAAGIGDEESVSGLLPLSTSVEQTAAIAAAAYCGKSGIVEQLLEGGVDPNGYPEKSSGFHSHATPLHQAVSSGSLQCVQLLVEAGSRIDAKDTIYDGTPLDWAEYLQRETDDEGMKKKYQKIGTYLRSVNQ